MIIAMGGPTTGLDGTVDTITALSTSAVTINGIAIAALTAARVTGGAAGDSTIMTLLGYSNAVAWLGQMNGQ